MFKNKRGTADVMKRGITNEITAIFPALLAAAFMSMKRRVRMLLQAKGYDFHLVL
jgi:hypothetical protein